MINLDFVLNLQDMQDQLVQIGDKPVSFVKSTDWIGSVEIRFRI